MRRATVLLCAATLCVPVIGQTPEKSDTVIRASTQEVALDIVVRDKKGKVVKGLQQNEVEVYEDGVKQTLKSFRLVQGRDVIVQEKSAPAGASATASVAKAGNPLGSVNLVCIVFHNIDPNTKKFAMEAAQEFIKNDMTPDTWVAVFNLSSQLTVLHPFTTNKKELLEATNHAFTGTVTDFVRVADAVLSAAPNIASIEVQVSGDPSKGGSVSSSMSITGGDLNTRTINDASVGTNKGAQIARGDLAGERLAFGTLEGQREADSVLAMINQFGTLQGRKSVLFMSPGMPTTGDADLYRMIVDRANRANVTVYAVDVNGLTQNANEQASDAAVSYAAKLSSGQANTGSGAAAREKMRQSDYLNNAVRTSNTQASLRGFAEGTGGFLIGSTNDLRKPFQKIVEDVETHYEATYSPTSHEYNGKLRTIEVKLAGNRSDLSISSRTGYFAMPFLGEGKDLTDADSYGMAALNVKTPPHAFPFEAAALQFKPGASDSIDAIAIEVPANTLTFTPEADGKRYKAHVSALALVKDSTGQVIDKFGQDVPYEVAEQNLSAVKGSPVNFSHPLSLPAGHYTVDLAVIDRESSRASIKSLTLDSPERSGVAISSIMIVQRAEQAKEKADAADPFQLQAEPQRAYKIVPELQTSVASTAKPLLYFVVYPDGAISGKASIQIEFLVNGQLVAKKKSDLEASADPALGIPVRIPAVMAVGNCEMRVTAFQGDSVAQKSGTYQVKGKS